MSNAALSSEKGILKVFIPWDKFKPTYRGKEKKDAQPLNLKTIKRMSIMMRRYEAPKPFRSDILDPVVQLLR